MKRIVFRAHALVLVTCLLLVLVRARTASANEASARPLVIVLRPRPGAMEAWAEGTQAVVAELVAGGYELLLRASSAEDRDGLLAELERAVAEDRVLGAVVVARDAERGVAYVCTRNGETVRVEAELSEGVVGEGTLALRITQLLGPPRFEIPKARTELSRPDGVSAPRPEPAASPHRLLLALEVGLAFSSDLAEPLPLLGLMARKGLVGPLALDAAGWFSLGASRLETSAGVADVTAEGVTLHLSFDPLSDRELGLSLGLGGGMVWVHGEGQAAEGYAAASDLARVALLSARAATFFTHNRWSLLLAVEPGVMLPAVSVGAGNGAARLGRPWTRASVGLGWNL